MSQTETHSGRFKIITRNEEDTKKFIQENLNKWWKIEEYSNGSWDIHETHEFIEEYWKPKIPFEYEVIYVNDEHWLIKYIKHKEFDEDEEIIEFSQNDDGSYDFIAQFYNGGTCLNEILGDIVAKNIK